MSIESFFPWALSSPENIFAAIQYDFSGEGTRSVEPKRMLKTLTIAYGYGREGRSVSEIY